MSAQAMLLEAILDGRVIGHVVASPDVLNRSPFVARADRPRSLMLRVLAILKTYGSHNACGKALSMARHRQKGLPAWPRSG